MSRSPHLLLAQATAALPSGSYSPAAGERSSRHEPRSWLATALFRLSHEGRELARARRSADREIIELRRVPARLVWRSNELTSEPRRKGLAVELRKLLTAADPRYLPNATPLRRGQVRINAESLRLLEARLLDGKPLRARGILLLEALLVDQDSPLYREDSLASLEQSLTRVSRALEGEL